MRVCVLPVCLISVIVCLSPRISLFMALFSCLSTCQPAYFRPLCADLSTCPCPAVCLLFLLVFLSSIPACLCGCLSALSSCLRACLVSLRVSVCSSLSACPFFVSLAAYLPCLSAWLPWLPVSFQKYMFQNPVFFHVCRMFNSPEVSIKGHLPSSVLGETSACFLL